MSLRLNNLGGTIMCEGKELIYFKFERDSLQEARFLTNDKYPMPFEFQGLSTVTEKSLRDFFDARITPDTRIGIHEELAMTKIGYYDPERMIRFNNGKCIHDWYYMVCDNDMTCWSDI